MKNGDPVAVEVDAFVKNEKPTIRVDEIAKENTLVRIEEADRALEVKRREILKMEAERRRLESQLALQRSERVRLRQEAEREEERISEARHLLNDLKSRQASQTLEQPAKAVSEVVSDDAEGRRKMQASGEQIPGSNEPIVSNEEKRIRARLAWEQLEKSVPEAYPEESED